MHLGIRLFLYALPFAIPFVGWKLSLLANTWLNCRALGKDPLPCIVAGIDIQPWLGLMAWFGMWLWWPGLLISGLLLGEYLAKRLPSPWGTRLKASTRRK